MTRSTRSLRSLLLVIPVIATLLATGAAVGSNALAVRAADAAAPEGRLIVFWKPGHSTAIADSRMASASTVAGRAGARSLVIARPGSAGALAAQLRSDPDVAAVIPDARVTLDDWPSSGSPNDPSYASNQAELPLIGVPTAWQTTTGSASVIVAIIDTGTTMNHEDLAGITFVRPYNEITGTAGAADDNGHGTHVTGTIAAQTNNGTSIAGIAPGVTIMPIKVLDASGSGWFSDFLAGVDYAVAHGAKMINMSLGGSLAAGSVAAMQPTFDAAYAAGVTIVAAAGNDSDSSIRYPCAFDHVICVAATDNSDAHASFSNANAYVRHQRSGRQ
jgi:thermitase